MAFLDGLRGLFGSSARQYVTTQPNDLRVNAAPGSAADRQFGAGAVLKRPPVLTPDLVTPRQEGSDRLQLLGAALSDAGLALRGGQGDALSRVQRGFRARSEQERAEQEFQQLSDLAQSLYGDDPEAQLAFKLAPDKAAAAILDARKPKEPQVLNTREGVFLYDHDGESLTPLREFEDPAPTGYEWKDGRLVFIPGGPADPDVVGRLSGVRREAVTSRPMPRQGGGGGRGGGAPSSEPWKQHWSP